MTRYSRLVATVLAAASLAACSLGPVRAPPRAPAVPRSPPSAPDVATIPDAVPRNEPRAARGNPPFYNVLGQRYRVLATADGYVERGVASWYGPTFHGVATSTGETYDMYAMTAAHKTLPLPCYARVTNLRNGRSVVVRINDRGPFVGNRIIDLSYTAATKLDMVREGTALVEVRVLTPGAPPAVQVASSAPGPAPTPAAPASDAPPVGPADLYVQAGAFASLANAQRLVERIVGAGVGHAFVKPAGGPKAPYRVRLGPVASVEQFDALVARLIDLGIADARLALD